MDFERETGKNGNCEVLSPFHFIPEVMVINVNTLKP